MLASRLIHGGSSILPASKATASVILRTSTRRHFANGNESAEKKSLYSLVLESAQEATRENRDTANPENSTRLEKKPRKKRSDAGIPRAKKKAIDAANLENPANLEKKPRKKRSDAEISKPKKTAKDAASPESSVGIIKKPRRPRSDLGKSHKMTGSSTPRNVEEIKPRKRRSDAMSIKEMTFGDYFSQKDGKYGGSEAEWEQASVAEFSMDKIDHPRGSVDRSRMNILSEGLCDDIIQRLGPSLEKHKGCDILDINPGVGLWSSKLHDTLKPRTHILMEPEYKNYAPYLGPLLQKKDSTYKLLPLSGILWDNLKKVESEGYLPHQKLREFGDPMLDKPNDTLLVTVNLGFYPRKQYIGFVSVASLVVHQLLSASRAHSIFQGYGQIRMLIWMHDFEKRMVLPRLLPLRSKSSLEAEISCKYIHEIAGSDQEEETYRREHELDRISMQRTAAKMAADGLVTPPHRMTRLEREINEEAKHNASHGGGIRRPYLDELEDLTGRLERKEVALSHDKQGSAQYYEGSTSRRKPGHQATKEWLRFLALTYRLTTENKSFDLLDAKMSEYEKLQTQWTELKKSTAGEKEQRMTEIEDAIVAWRKDVEMQPYRVQKDIMWRLEERRCAHNEPPALMWDRRTAEPLVARAEEFAPAQTMALLDIQPRTIWPVLQGEGLSNYDFFEFMLTVMFSVSKQSVREGLKTLAPGADEWIMPRCPSLTDTENGGVVNPDLLSVRSLTERQWREIFECFMAWPFRPTRGQLLSRVGSQDLHIDEEDNDYTMNA